MSKNQKKKEVVETVETTEVTKKTLNSIKRVHPFGSKILVEIPHNNELIKTTKLVLSEDVQANNDHAPQAIIIELGQNIPEDYGLKAGQRVYWTGRGSTVNNTQAYNNRVMAILEVSNIIAVIEEE